MPNKDRTGPAGGGSRTGRGLGDCPKTTKSVPSRPRRGGGRGPAKGPGRRRRD